VVPAAVHILQAYPQQNPQLIDEHFDKDTFHSAYNLLVDYIKDPLKAVRQDRKEPSLEEDPSCSNYILDHVGREGE
jgi:hypothetical protein